MTPDRGRVEQARKLDRRAATRWAKHDDLGAGVRDATDGVDELAFDERPALDFKPETNEEGRSGIEVGHGDADVIELAEFDHQQGRPSRTGQTSA